MNKFCFEQIKNYYKSYISKIIIIYMILGILIFSFSNLDLSYINMVYYLMGHPYLISFFLIPIVLFTSIDLIRKVNNEKSFIIRFNNKNLLFRQCLKIIIGNCTYILLLFLFIVLLFTNIFSDRSKFVLKDSYYPDVSNITVLFFIIIKIYIYLIFISLLHLFPKRRILYVFIIFYDILMLISFLGYMPSYFDFFLPSNYLGYHYISSSFEYNIFQSLTCLLLNTLFCLIIFRQSVLRKDL